tara:strand:- start:3953 stop:4792 length:840 start_codon:yes stop_codon:yes gene_type:complete
MTLNSKEYDDDVSRLKVLRETEFYDKALNYYASNFDLNLINFLKEYPEDLFLVEGLFQSEKYFFEYDILEFIDLRINVEYKKVNLNWDNVCILNIRGGEYKRHKKFNLSKAYWLECVEHIKKTSNVKDFKIITDDPIYTRLLLPEFETLSLSLEECFMGLFRAKFLIVSNSTFSFFPIKLDKTPKKIILAPAYFSRPYNKENRWCSPANIYKNWSYYDIKQKRILLDCEVHDILRNTLEYYFYNNNLSINKVLKSPSSLSRVVKNILRPILKKLIPQTF